MSSRGPVPQRSHIPTQSSGLPDESPKEDGHRYSTSGAGPSQSGARHNAPESSMRGTPALPPPQRKTSSHSQGGRYEGMLIRFKPACSLLILYFQDRHQYLSCCIRLLHCQGARSRNSTCAITKHGSSQQMTEMDLSVFSTLHLLPSPRNRQTRHRRVFPARVCSPPNSSPPSSTRISSMSRRSFLSWQSRTLSRVVDRRRSCFMPWQG